MPHLTQPLQNLPASTTAASRRVLLATHLSPIIHGQALMSSQLADLARQWTDIEFHTLNTVYAESREQLRGGSINKLKKLRRYLIAAKQILHDQKIDTLIVTPAFFLNPFFKDQYFARSLKRASQTKVIGWVHMDPNRLALETLPKPVAKLAKNLVGNIDQWVCCAPALAAQWPSWLTDSMKQTPIAIANGIPDPYQGRTPAPRENKRYRITYLSSMDPEKGWRELFTVAQAVCNQHEQCEFHFYGDLGANESSSELTETFANSTHPDRIQWHGATWDQAKFDALARADLFVFPSHTEQFPIAVLEAMAHALPIIATDVGAVRDALPKQSLLKPQDTSGLQQQIIDFLAQPAKFRQQGEQNRVQFLENFSLAAFSKAWHDHLINP